MKKPLRVGIVSDASQFYEATSVFNALLDMSWSLMQVEKRSGLPNVSILRGKKVSGHLGGNIPANGYVPSGAMTVVSLE